MEFIYCFWLIFLVRKSLILLGYVCRHITKKACNTEFYKINFLNIINGLFYHFCNTFQEPLDKTFNNYLKLVSKRLLTISWSLYYYCFSVRKLGINERNKNVSWIDIQSISYVCILKTIHFQYSAISLLYEHITNNYCWYIIFPK